MFSNHLFIRFRVLSLVTLFVCCLSSCDKEATLPIPDQLTDSEWSMMTAELRSTLRFTSDTECTLTEQPADAEATTYHYHYTYQNPNLALTPLAEDRDVLSGSIFRWDKKSIGLTLYDPEDNLVFQSSQSADSFWK